jgi:hypothetical protein
MYKVRTRMSEMKVKFHKTELNYMKCFLSECGEYKVINYGGKIHLFKKDYFINHATKKKYRAFGNSVEIAPTGNSMTYRTYRDAFRAANKNEKYKGGGGNAVLQDIH